MNRLHVLATATMILTLVAGCVGANPTLVPVPPSATPVPATATLVPPTATLVPPAATPKPTATATRLPPLSGSGGGRIVFSPKRDDNYEIYTFDVELILNAVLWQVSCLICERIPRF
jgi:hypothetical protein